MVSVWQRCLLLVLLVSSAAFAGCIGDDPAPEPKEDADPTGGAGTPDPKVDPALPSPSKKVLSKIDSKEAVFAPTWKEGQWWTFEVAGSARPPATATLAVVELAEDHYKLGSDSDVELAYNMLNNGPFIPRGKAGIQFDSFSFYQADSYQDYIGFSRPVGDQWEVAMIGLKFQVTKVAVTEIEDPKGPTMGIVVNGTAPAGETFKVTYSDAAQWISSLSVTHSDGTDLLSYKLSGYGETGGADVKRWERKDTFSLNAQSPAYPVDAWYEQSDGSGDLRVIALHLRNGYENGEAHATVYDPMGQEVASETVKSGASWSYFFVDDAEGLWLARAHAIGGNSASDRAKSDIFMLQVGIL